jgi:hypothetical protein
MGQLWHDAPKLENGNFVLKSLQALFLHPD